MKILFSESFLYRLESQIEYISKDSPARARKFKAELLAKIKAIPKRPLSHRKSIYFEDETVRYLIFKGYIVVFRLTGNTIEVFGFVKFQNEPSD